MLQQVILTGIDAAFFVYRVIKLVVTILVIVELVAGVQHIFDVQAEAGTFVHVQACLKIQQIARAFIDVSQTARAIRSTTFAYEEQSLTDTVVEQVKAHLIIRQCVAKAGVDYVVGLTGQWPVFGIRCGIIVYY